MTGTERTEHEVPTHHGTCEIKGHAEMEYGNIFESFSFKREKFGIS